MKTFIVDLDKCNGCYGCQLACKDETVGNDWMPYSKPQPKTGQFWLRMTEKVHGTVPKVRVEYRPEMCRHCDNAPCVAAAPDSVYKRDDGLVIIDPEKAAGNKALVDACPYNAIYWNEDLNIPQKCTGCAHLVDEGKLPHCVEACATGALRFGEEEDFAAEIAESEGNYVIGEEKPRVHYLHPFKLFLAGEVWDPDADLIIEGASITIEDENGSKQETQTDGFGDFWFWHIGAGRYIMTIEADGFKTITREIDLQESTNLGDFPMEKM